MKNHQCLLMLLLFAIGCNVEPDPIPEYFNEVDQTLWVVKNIENVVQNWKNMGFEGAKDYGEVEVTLKLAKEKGKVRMAKANFGGAFITWIQPLEGNSVFKQFHQEHGDVAMGLVHRVADAQALKKEVKRLKKIGVEVLEEVQIDFPEGKLNYVLMNTVEQGKYVLGYTYGSEDMELKNELLAPNRHNMKLSQYAFALKAAEPTSTYWNKLGFPAFTITPARPTETTYRGEAEKMELSQGWQRQGNIPYEWCIPELSPNVFDDHIEAHGEGIHHLAFNVKDMDVVIEDYAEKGYAISASGAWGEKGKPGSGRFAYVDLEEAGGVSIELLWNYKESK